MSVHDGHRARLKRRFESEGLDAFQPHEALELLLFQTVVRRDVNPLAHDLVDRFGSLAGVFEAGERALLSVPGVSARTAALLSFLPEFFDFYRARRLAERPAIQNLSAARAYCRRLLDGQPGGRLWLLHLNAGGGLLLAESLPAEGGHPRPCQVIERALSSRAQALVLAARRENAAAAPDDRAFAGTLFELLSMIGVSLLDSLLMDGDQSLSMRREGLLAAPLREPGGPGLRERGWLWEEEDGAAAVAPGGEPPGGVVPGSS